MKFRGMLHNSSPLFSATPGNKSLAMDALASTVVASCDPNRSGDQAENVRQRVNLVEDPAGHVTLKKVIANDRDLMLLGKDGV